MEGITRKEALGAIDVQPFVRLLASVHLGGVDAAGVVGGGDGPVEQAAITTSSVGEGGTCAEVGKQANAARL